MALNGCYLNSNRPNSEHVPDRKLKSGVVIRPALVGSINIIFSKKLNW